MLSTAFGVYRKPVILTATSVAHSTASSHQSASTLAASFTNGGTQSPAVAESFLIFKGDKENQREPKIPFLIDCDLKPRCIQSDYILPLHGDCAW